MLDVVNLAVELEINVTSTMPDHSLLVWTLNLKSESLRGCADPPPPKTTRRRMPNNFLESDSAKSKLEGMCSKFSQVSCTEGLSEVYSQFCKVLESELVISERSNTTRKHKPWWNSNLSNLRKQVRLARNEWKVDKKVSSLKASYLSLQKQFDCEVKRSKNRFQREQHEKFAYSLKKNPGQFWRLMRNLDSHTSRKRQGVPNRVLDSNGDTVSNSSEVLRIGSLTSKVY